MPIFYHVEIILLGQEKWISSHFGNLVKLNAELLNLSSDLLNNKLPIIPGRIFNSNRGSSKCCQEM